MDCANGFVNGNFIGLCAGKQVNTSSFHTALPLSDGAAAVIPHDFQCFTRSIGIAEPPG
jgi:hypothetical protein